MMTKTLIGTVVLIVLAVIDFALISIPLGYLPRPPWASDAVIAMLALAVLIVIGVIAMWLKIIKTRG
jgi:hypothetical protein